MNVVSISAIREAASIVDGSGVVDLLTQWDKADARYRGGRPSTMSLRTLLIAWLTVALEEQPLHITRVAELLTARLSPKAAEVMGASYLLAQVSPDVMYDRVHRATQRFIDALDYQPLPTRQRRLLRGEWERVEIERDERADELESKRRRLFQFAKEYFNACHYYRV